MQCRRAEMVIYGIAKFLSLSVPAAVTLIVFSGTLDVEYLRPITSLMKMTLMMLMKECNKDFDPSKLHELPSGAADRTWWPLKSSKISASYKRSPLHITILLWDITKLHWDMTT